MQQILHPINADQFTDVDRCSWQFEGPFSRNGIELTQRISQLSQRTESGKGQLVGKKRPGNHKDSVSK